MKQKHILFLMALVLLLLTILQVIHFVEYDYFIFSNPE